MELTGLITGRGTYIGATIGAIIMLIPGFFLGIMIGTQIGGAGLQDYLNRLVGSNAPNVMWVGFAVTFLLVVILCALIGALCGGFLGMTVSSRTSTTRGSSISIW